MNGVAKGIINDQLGVHLHLLVQHSQGLARICTQISPVRKERYAHAG